MGYCLFYEAMFDSVIYARDNFLKSDGIMIPNIAEFFIAATLHQEQSFENVEGFNMNKIAACNSNEPLIGCI
jgi:predicted HAD superfamily hydrolase